MIFRKISKLTSVFSYILKKSFICRDILMKNLWIKLYDIRDLLKNNQGWRRMDKSMGEQNWTLMDNYSCWVTLYYTILSAFVFETFKS